MSDHIGMRILGINTDAAPRPTRAQRRARDKKLKSRDRRQARGEMRRQAELEKKAREQGVLSPQWEDIGYIEEGGR